MILRNGRFLSVFILLCGVLVCSSAVAEKVEYFYDELGRLSKVIPGIGNAIIYTYDDVGNLLSIKSEDIKKEPPILNAINPDVVYSGTDTVLYIFGKNLLSTEKVDAGTGIAVNRFTATDSMIAANISISLDASTGVRPIIVTSRYGSGIIDVTVYRVDASPTARYLNVGEAVDIIASVTPAAQTSLIVPVSNLGTNIINTNIASLTIPAGGVATLNVKALSEGTAVLYIGGTKIVIFVPKKFSGDLSLSSPAVNVLPNFAIDGSFSSGPVAVLRFVPESLGGGFSSEPVAIFRFIPEPLDGGFSSEPVNVQMITQ